MNFTKFHPQLSLALFTLLVSLIFYSIFHFNLPSLFGFPDTSLQTIYSNYDGPNYLVISRCWYRMSCIARNYSLPQPLEYYPAHLPGYPLIIGIIKVFVHGPFSLILASLFGSIFLTLSSYHFFKIYLKQKTAYLLSLILLIFPARLLILRLVGAPEGWFIGAILTSIVLFNHKKYLASALMVSFAWLLKSPGLILLAAFIIVAYKHYQKTRSFTSTFQKYKYYLLVPITVLLTFIYYYRQTGDFFAYFHSGDNIHLNLLPYTVFLSFKSWIGTIWLEDIIYIFLLSFLGIQILYRRFQSKIVFVFPFLYLVVCTLVAHRDISRYISPIYPFLFLAFSKTLKSGKFKLALLLITPAIFLYVINFIIGNTAPVADWTPYA